MRSKGSGSIRKKTRPNGKVIWEGRVTIGYDPGTGKRIMKSVYGSTQHEVQQKIMELNHAVEHHTYHEPTKITVSAWCDEYLETFVRDTVKPLTYSKYESVIRNHIKPSIGAMKLMDVTGIDVQKMINKITRAGRDPKTVKDVAALTSKIFKTAVNENLIDANPCARLQSPKVVRKDVSPLSPNDIAKFLVAIEEDPEFRNAFAICLFAGLREGELLGLSWENIDLQNQELYICQQLQKMDGEWKIIKATKSSRSRTVRLPDIAMPYLQDQLQRQVAYRFQNASMWSNEEDLVFTNQIGEPLSKNAFYNHFKAIAASIGRPEAKPHDLRHTAATVAIASGADIKSVQSLLGHATAAFTLNVYAHATEQMKKDTANRLDAFYKSL